MVKKGYKQTEIGIIPEDWDVNSLKSIVVGNLKYGINAAAIPYNSNLPQYLRITDITEDGRFSKKDRTSVKVSNLDSYWLHSNDIVFARTGASTGKTYLYREKDGDMVYAGFLIKANIDTLKADPVFIFYQFHTNRYWNWVATISQRSGQPGINSKEYSSFDIILPKLEEQKAIATALSDVDNLIDNLEKLIEKKKKIKQGTMQELLTKKKRLSCKSPKWSYQTLESLCYLITKQTGFDYSAEIKPSLVNKPLPGYIPFIQNKDFEGYKINLNTDFYIPLSIAEKYPKIKLDEKCLLISISGRIGNVGLFNEPLLAFIGGAVGIAKFNNKNLIEWCMIYLQSIEGQKQIFANEKTGAQRNLTIEDIRKLMIPIPSEEEQTYIIEILTNMDQEIEIIEKKLNKTKLIKKGMMQKLLTGEIRLI